MADKSLTLRLNKVLRELNISLDRAVEYLSNVGCEIEARPTTKISQETYELLLEGFKVDKSKKDESAEISEEKRKEKSIVLIPFLRHGDSQKEECVFWKVYAWLGLSVKVGTLFFHQVVPICIW